ncbi:MAG: glycosyltransferase family 2 protein [Prevotellaceae bacterium]|jgi:glycosyltransferase involved in cell wall biosynthesis|nr:glycosyltransferase family 2 protein [Prevotellaceae bacterium]
MTPSDIEAIQKKYTPEVVSTVFRKHDVCVVVPTYNNKHTLFDLLDRIGIYTDNIWVVDDGSTDGTWSLLEQRESVCLNHHERNLGKGKSLQTAFRGLHQFEFNYALTIDADGQHFPEDLPLFAAALEAHPDALIVGSRNLQQANMPGKNTFANRFSNFWFYLQTGQRLPDTQTGYRLYPLARMFSGASKIWLPARYEAELLLLVQSAWRGIRLQSVPVRVYYPPRGERVSHFRPVADFARISLLNTLLCAGAVVYGFPMRLVRHFKQRKA